jgi:hypothetical protein
MAFLAVATIDGLFQHANKFIDLSVTGKISTIVALAIATGVILAGAFKLIFKIK